jgi:hypothetical protein
VAFRLLETAGAGASEAVEDTLLLSCGSLEEIRELNGTGPAAPLGDDPEAWVRERCARAATKETVLCTGLPPVATGPTLPSGELAPGRYETTTPGPSVMFEVTDAGWFADDIPTVGFALSREQIRGGVSLTSFPGEVFTKPCSPAELTSTAGTAQAFIDVIAANPELKATQPKATKLGGHDALQIDVTADVPPECPDSPRIWLWVLPYVGDFHLDEGEAARFITAEVGETTLVLTVETFDPTQQEALLKATDALLATMTIQP